MAHISYFHQRLLIEFQSIDLFVADDLHLNEPYGRSKLMSKLMLKMQQWSDYLCCRNIYIVGYV